MADRTPGPGDVPPLTRALHGRRDALGMSRAATARQLGVSRHTVLAWETGFRQLSLPSAYAYAQLLHSQPELRAVVGGTAPIPLGSCAAPGTVGARLWPVVRQFRAGRRAREWTVAHVADRIGVSSPAVVAWERGDRQMSVRYAHAYADLLGCTLGLAPLTTRDAA
ncbi:helix-turn-helix transcriptional regulator [Actinomadura sp. LOL_016]|uniref:helix-turn-helix transcriptional regulator n=1 Tax=unclassified Actinomadura TaxID=2626254 RepID=UPI003A7FC345